MTFQGNRSKAVELLAIPNAFRNYDEIAKEIGVSQNTLYKWRKEDGFQEAVIKRTQEIMGDSFQQVVEAHLRRAKSGDMVAIKEYYERVLGKVTTPIEFEGSVSLVEVAAALTEGYEERKDEA